MKSNKKHTSTQQSASDKMQQSKQHHESAPQGASDKVTNVVAAGDRRDTNALAIPPRKDRRKMQIRIWKRVSQAISFEPYFNILSAAADQMLNDLERGNKTESDLFASDGNLTDVGHNYVEEVFEDGIGGLEWSDTIDGVATVLDKECFTFFMIERAAAKQAEEKHTPKRTGSIG